MTLNDLGKRLERLLILALPLSALCLVSTFVQLASVEYSTKSERFALQKFSAAIVGLRPDLDKFFEDARKVPAKERYARHHAILQWKELGIYEHVTDYQTALDVIAKAAIDGHGVGSAAWLAPYKGAKNSPEQIIAAAAARAKAVESSIQVGEIVVPVKPNVSILGTNLSIPLPALAGLGYFVSCLAMIIWCGALRLTRRRELFALVSTGFRGQGFPHLLNSTMVQVAIDPRSARGRAAKINRGVHKTILVILRTTVLALLASVTIVPLAYAGLVAGFDFVKLSTPKDLVAPYWTYLIVAAIPLFQMFAIWLEEMYWLALTPVRILVLGRDIVIREAT